MEKYREWVEEARNDIVGAENLGQAGLYSLACFHCQQALEKALKALLEYQNKDVAKTHSLRELATRAGVLKDLQNFIALVDADYSATRYFDVTDKAPRKLYEKEMYLQRIASAKKAMELIESWMKD